MVATYAELHYDFKNSNESYLGPQLMVEEGDISLIGYK